MVVVSLFAVQMLQYRGSSHYVNFISANFITAIFQNIPEIFALWEFWANYFISVIFGAKNSRIIALMK
jgi:hypothetical protein